MAKPLPQITVVTEAEAHDARAEVQSVQARADQSAGSYSTVSAAAHRPEDEEKPKDYFVERDGLRFAGSHLIVDMWGAQHLTDEARMEEAFIAAIEAAGATLLHIHLHKFSGGGGISGVAVLAESHISVHTWPERDYAAFDVFMCGEAQPAKAVETLKRYFEPKMMSVGEHKRGVF